jgi:hypothetical protein
MLRLARHAQHDGDYVTNVVAAAIALRVRNLTRRQPESIVNAGGFAMTRYNGLSQSAFALIATLYIVAVLTFAVEVARGMYVPQLPVMVSLVFLSAMMMARYSGHQMNMKRGKAILNRYDSVRSRRPLGL